MNKKVLVTVCGGVAYVYSDTGIEVGILDFDNDNTIKIHSSFLPLMRLANIENMESFLSDDGLNDVAQHIDETK